MHLLDIYIYMYIYIHVYALRICIVNCYNCSTIPYGIATTVTFVLIHISRQYSVIITKKAASSI